MRTTKLGRSKNKLLLGGSVFFAASSAFAIYGDGYEYFSDTRGFIGDETVLDAWFADDPCFDDKPIQYTAYPDVASGEYLVDPEGVALDNNSKTFFRCRQVQSGQMTCELGLADGTVVACTDGEGPARLPQPDDLVRLAFYFDSEFPNDPGTYDVCDIVVERSYGEADPKCRADTGTGGSGSGGSSATGGGSSGGTVCDATTAQAVLGTSMDVNIASNACVRLKNEVSWSTINPKLVAVSENGSAYPVDFSYSAPCTGQSGTGTLTGQWNEAYLFDGTNDSQPNFGCDVYVQLEGDGSLINFNYYQ